MYLSSPGLSCQTAKPKDWGSCLGLFWSAPQADLVAEGLVSLAGVWPAGVALLAGWVTVSKDD